MQFLIDGLKLMVVGMGMVFFFLTVMIFWINLSSKLSSRFAHLLPDDPKPAPRRSRKPAPATTAAAPAAAVSQAPLAAVIGAAVQMYRQERGLK